MKRILFDVNSVIIRKEKRYLSGIGRTALELLTALERKRSLPFEIIVSFQSLRGDAKYLKDISFSKFELPFPGSLQFKKIVNKFHFKEIITKYDLLHIPHNYDFVNKPQKTVVTIHDALFFSYPENFLGHDYARVHYSNLAKECQAIVTCSNSSKSDIVKYMSIPPEKITVIPWGVSKEVFYPENNEVVNSTVKELGINRPYFLMVSCDIGRKNSISLLRSYKKFLSKNPEHDLVMVWSSPPQEILKEFSAEIETQRIHFIKIFSNDILRSVYNGATVSFYPSKYEGFGLPVLESMACGTPVVTCKNSALSEIGGDTALYTDPDNLDSMIAYMEQFESGFSNYNELIDKCRNHSSLYRWEECAEKYISFYQNFI